MGKKIVIIGGVAAGPKVAARARRLDPEAEITIVERGRLISYAGCGMPFYLAGQIKDFNELFKTRYGVKRDGDFFLSERNVRVLTLTEAVAIDRQKKEVKIVDLTTRKESFLPYDKLVLATGSEPVAPPLEGLSLKGVHRLNRPEDALKIAAELEGAREAVVIGAGMIGMEAADALAARKLFVSFVELKDQILPGMLDPDLAALLKTRLEEKGVEFYLGEKVIRLEGNEEGRVAKVVTDRRTINAGLVVIAVGVRPNVTLAKEAGLAIGETGGITVNEFLQTSDPDIYALGDCVENVHLVSGRRVYMPLASTAARQGRVVGDNVTGGKSKFPGVLGTAALKLMGFNVGRTGLGEEQAKEAGFDILVTTIAGFDRTHYYPEFGRLVLKLITEAKTGRVLGAQGFGDGDVVKRIDVLACAINYRATVEDLSTVDLAYAPPFNNPLDPVHHAVNTVRNKMQGIAKGIPAKELREKLDGMEDFILLDVRTLPQHRVSNIADERSVVVPLGELRQRLSELPREKEVFVYCAIGGRSYEAQRILESAGFSKVRFLEGGLYAWPYDLD
ncbi:MAG: FAD-dependent oxidoreductase [Desulfotomaculales bacterium]